MPPTPGPRPRHVQFSSADLAAEMATRAKVLHGDEADSASLGSVAKRDLERYYDTLERELRLLRLAPEEAALICDALNGCWLGDTQGVRYVWAEVADHIRLDGAATKWSVADPDGLVTRIRDLSPGATMALVDAVERWWGANPVEGDEGWRPSLERVGLVRPEPA